jgi:hypothetical protein
MLHAFFDDSGTHSGSDIVLMAGVFGHPNQWDYFSDLWAKKLADPCPGKPPLTRFHMAHCQAGDGEFSGWNRTETDYLVHELGTIILNVGIFGFGGAIARKHYNELIIGDLRRSSGDAETMCIINSFVKVITWAKEFAPGHSLALVFEDRPQKKRDIQKIYDVYRGFTDGPETSDSNIASVSFASSKKILPLQAADLFAWEIYQDSLDSLAGRRESEGPRRKQLLRLMKGGRLRVELCGPDNVLNMARTRPDPAMLKALADHVDFT